MDQKCRTVNELSWWQIRDNQKDGSSQKKSHKDICSIGREKNKRSPWRATKNNETMSGLGNPCITNDSSLRDYSGTLCISCFYILPKVPIAIHHPTEVRFL